MKQLITRGEILFKKSVDDQHRPAFEEIGPRLISMVQFCQEDRGMMTMLDSLGLRRGRPQPRRAKHDGRRRERNAVLHFNPGCDPIALERRTLLSTVNWINAAGGDWDRGSNWNTGSVPGASDNVTIDLAPGITVTHSQSDDDSVNTLTLASADTLSILGGSLSIESASTIDGTFNLTGGTLKGAGTLTVTGALTLNDGEMAGTGQTIATGDVSIEFGILDTRLFTIEGTATLSGNLEFYNSAGVSIAAAATFDVPTVAGLFLMDSSPATFSNAGDFNVGAGVGNTMIDNGVPFTNSGAVTVSSGLLGLYDPGGTESGSFTVASNAALSPSARARSRSRRSPASPGTAR